MRKDDSHLFIPLIRLQCLFLGLSKIPHSNTLSAMSTFKYYILKYAPFENRWDNMVKKKQNNNELIICYKTIMK